MYRNCISFIPQKSYKSNLSSYITWKIKLWWRAHNNNLKGEEKVGIYYYTFITKMQTEASMKLMENFRMLQTCRWTLMKKPKTDLIMIRWFFVFSPFLLKYFFTYASVFSVSFYTARLAKPACLIETNLIETWE